MRARAARGARRGVVVSALRRRSTSQSSKHVWLSRPIDRDLLLRSLAHRSWCAENGEPESNERLEFLGDSVLGLMVTHYVFEHFPSLPEGQLSEVRAGVVNAQVLAEVAFELDLGAHLLLGKGEDAAGGRAKQSILADAFEAVVAAVYLDQGFAVARDVVLRCLQDRIADAAAGPGGPRLQDAPPGDHRGPHARASALHGARRGSRSRKALLRNRIRERSPLRRRRRPFQEASRAGCCMGGMDASPG